MTDNRPSVSGSCARLGRDRYASALRDRPRQHHSLSNKITTSPGARQRGVSEAPDRTRPEASRRRSGRLYEEVSARKLRSCGSADGGRHRQSRAMVAAGGRAPTGSTAGRAPPGRDTRPARYATTSSVTATGGQPVDWQRDTSRTAAAAYPTVARLLSAVGGTGAELLVCVQAKTTICAEVPARLKPFDDAVIGILGLRGAK